MSHAVRAGRPALAQLEREVLIPLKRQMRRRQTTTGLKLRGRQYRALTHLSLYLRPSPMPTNALHTMVDAKATFLSALHTLGVMGLL